MHLHDNASSVESVKSCASAILMIEAYATCAEHAHPSRPVVPGHACWPLQCFVSAQQYTVPSTGQLATPSHVAMHDALVVQFATVGGGAPATIGSRPAPGTSRWTCIQLSAQNSRYVAPFV